MIDPHAAVSLRKLFARHVSERPSLIPEAEIIFENAAGSRFKIKTGTPEETANILTHISNNDGNGIFDRLGAWGKDKPLYLRMNKVICLKADQKEAQMLAFNFTFRELDKPSHLYLSDPETNDYYWQGDEKIENRPPMSFEGPQLHDLIAVLNRAGNCWQDVNFIKTQKRPPIALVHSNG